MEYSSDKVMTRKEYLKTKKKGKLGFRIVKYSLLLVVIVLLSIYLFKQLDVYNNVTKMANKVIEETALAKTMTMYYVADSYTKDGSDEVIMYKSYDESRTKIEGTEGFTNIQIVDGILYGISEQKLYSINLETLEKTEIVNIPIKAYVLNDNKIYCYIVSDNSKETGIYVFEQEKKELKHVINLSVNQFLVDDNYIFVISKGKTEKSIIRYNINGEGRTVITNKEIVTHMKQDKNNIYYIADDKLYSIKKNGKDNTVVMDDRIYIPSHIKSIICESNAFVIKDEVLYYIINGDKHLLCAFNTKTKEKQTISKKNVESLQLQGNILYYKVENGIGIYKTNLENGKTEHVTNIRGSEYICIN